MISLQKVTDTAESFCGLSPGKVESILAASALDAIRENQRFGLPVITKVDGKVVRIDAFEAEAQLLKNFPELATTRSSSSAASP